MKHGSDPRATLAEIAAHCSTDFPMPGLQESEHVFDEPWQATAFALTVALHQRGVFSWADWAQTLGRRIAAHPDDGRAYYQHWLGALEDMVQRCRLGSEAELQGLQQAWREAAERTPHGQPIEL
jgi:nitrile hydratase accessory protein